MNATALDTLPKIQPPCPHAGLCGGCAHQDRPLDALADWKRAYVAAALRRRDLDVEVLPTVQAPPRSRRRARFAATRTKKGVRLGFHRARSHEIVDIPECWLIRPGMRAAFPALRDLAGFAAPRARPIGLWVTESDTGLDVAVEGGKALDLDLRQRAAEWTEAADRSLGVARLAWNGETVSERRSPSFRIGGADVAPPPGGFLQAAAEGEAALAEIVLRETEGAKRVVDLFCGVGAFALRLASRSEVLALDGSSDAIAALKTAWRRGDGLRRVVATARDLFRRPLRAEELRGLDAAVFDPPRQGAEAQVQELRAFEGSTIVGVSCDADTFARDAATLVEGGWRLGPVTPVDQFLWSNHVELIGAFRR